MPPDLPHSEEAERALLGRVLLDPAQGPVLFGELAADDFFTPEYRTIWRAMVEVSSAGRVIDLMTLEDALGSWSHDLLRGLTGAHRAPVEEYAAIIRRDARRRRLIGRLDTVVSSAYDEEDWPTLVGRLQSAVNTVMADTDDGNLLSIESALGGYQQTLARRKKYGGSGLAYGIWAIDSVMQPAQGGDFIVVAARPGVGKTVLAEMLVDHWSLHAAFPVLFVSLEMSQDQLQDRAVTRATGIPTDRLMRWDVTPEEELRIDQAIEDRRAHNIAYLDEGGASTAMVRAAAAKTKLVAGGLTAIVIDYIQLLTDQSNQNEVYRVAGITRAVKQMGREFGVPIVALSQLNRAVEMRDDPHPRLSDLRDSGSVEQDADIVFALCNPYRDSHIDTDLDVLKNRQGRPGSRIRLVLDTNHLKFQEN